METDLFGWFDFSQTADLDDDEIAAAVSPILDKPEQVIALNDSETALEIKDAPSNGNHSDPGAVLPW